MILCKKHKFIFIKGRKVAGTSLEIFLAQICDKNDIITPITPIDEKYRLTNGIRTAQNYGIFEAENNKYLSLLSLSDEKTLLHIKPPKKKFYNHMSLREILKLYGEISEKWTIFAFERNPYHKIISLANMRLGFTKYKQTGKPIKNELKSIKNQIQKNIDDGSVAIVKNIDLYKDNKGKIIPNILPYENLEEELYELMDKLNISNFPTIGHFKKGILSSKIDPLAVFTSKQLSFINEVFDEEFKYFGYKKLS
jgi:hypothetical protein